MHDESPFPPGSTGLAPAIPDLPTLAEEALQWFTSWPDGLLAVDGAFRVVYLSPRGQELLGWTPDAVRGHQLHELVCANGREPVHTRDDCPLCTPEIDADQVFSTWWQTRNGRHISVDCRLIPVTGCRTTRLISFYDNRTRSHSHREMARYREFVDLCPLPMAEFDGNGLLLSGNAALQDVLLFHGFDELGKGRIWPPDMPALCRSVWKRQKVVDDVEVRIDDNWYRWSFHPSSSDAGPGVMAYLFDITGQKAAEIRSAQQKNAVIRDFFTSAVDELRPPLNVIGELSGQLQKSLGNSLSERDLAALRAIYNASVQLNELVCSALPMRNSEPE
jgi:two-component system autoinducer 2 sensor kinase/phosphatase LuxQ